jgi:iron uptake system EfeUOB component EfeO/EfeM
MDEKNSEEEEKIAKRLMEGMVTDLEKKATELQEKVEELAKRIAQPDLLQRIKSLEKTDFEQSPLTAEIFEQYRRKNGLIDFSKLSEDEWKQLVKGIKIVKETPLVKIDVTFNYRGKRIPFTIKIER